MSTQTVRKRVSNEREDLDAGAEDERKAKTTRYSILVVPARFLCGISDLTVFPKSARISYPPDVAVPPSDQRFHLRQYRRDWLNLLNTLEADLQGMNRRYKNWKRTQAKIKNARTSHDAFQAELEKNEKCVEKILSAHGRWPMPKPQASKCSKTCSKTCWEKGVPIPWMMAAVGGICAKCVNERRVRWFFFFNPRDEAEAKQQKIDTRFPAEENDDDSPLQEEESQNIGDLGDNDAEPESAIMKENDEVRSLTQVFVWYCSRYAKYTCLLTKFQEEVELRNKLRLCRILQPKTTVFT
ncbi:hypothetical protein BC937DRAFT_88600 [Endogone sp. FLAS-F59071]|nr:hypothetical protein BC937DRAFT_88600 [Endogone sp. FLAS-F59071]|eukprot:RUS18571.1 hypothetical protein BC937DRAFT_88600 [Endogone sp. FLAS-F59071]